MRKTSYDGAECSSLSSIDNDHKKPGILKSTRNSIKRKVQNFSHESDDAVIEPLLEKDEANAISKGKSAPKSISQQIQESVERQTKQVTYAFKSKDTSEHTMLISSVTKEEPLICVTEYNISKPIEANAVKNSYISSFTKPLIIGNNDVTNHKAEVHNVLSISIHGVNEKNVTEKMHTDEKGSRSYYSPSPLIFTTAKIHEDAKVTTKNPVLVTASPIVSTLENKIKKEDDNKHQRLTADLQTPLLKMDTKSVGSDVTKKSIVDIDVTSMINFNDRPSNTNVTKTLVENQSYVTVTSTAAIMNKKPQELVSIIASMPQSLPSITKFIPSESNVDHKSKVETANANINDKSKTNSAKATVQLKGTNVTNKDAPKLQKTPTLEQTKHNKSKENIVNDKVIKDQDKKEKAKIISQSSKDSTKTSTPPSFKTKSIATIESKKSQEEPSAPNNSKVKAIATDVSNKAERSKLIRQGKTEEKPDVSTKNEKPSVVGKIEKEIDKSPTIKKDGLKDKPNPVKITASTSGNIAKNMPIKTTKASGNTTVTQVTTKASNKVDLRKNNKDKKVPK